MVAVMKKPLVTAYDLAQRLQKGSLARPQVGKECLIYVIGKGDVLGCDVGMVANTEEGLELMARVSYQKEYIMPNEHNRITFLSAVNVCGVPQQRSLGWSGFYRFLPADDAAFQEAYQEFYRTHQKDGMSVLITDHAEIRKFLNMVSMLAEKL